MTYTQGMSTPFEWWPRSEQTTVATTVTVYTPLETVDELSMDRATVNEASRESDSTTPVTKFVTTRERTVSSPNTITTQHLYLTITLLGVTSQE